MHSLERLHISSTNLEEGSFRDKKRKACHARYIIMRTAAKFQAKITSPRSIYKYIVLARAKSEALDNIYSLLKQNIKSCNAKRRRQRERGKNNNRSN